MWLFLGGPSFREMAGTVFPAPWFYEIGKHGRS